VLFTHLFCALSTHIHLDAKINFPSAIRAISLHFEPPSSDEAKERRKGDNKEIEVIFTEATNLTGNEVVKLARSILFAHAYLHMCI
jgi:hypothetical protein